MLGPDTSFLNKNGFMTKCCLILQIWCSVFDWLVFWLVGFWFGFFFWSPNHSSLYRKVMAVQIKL